MVNIKGTVLNSAINYIKEVYDSEEFAEVLQQMSAEYRKEAGDNILASHWYPIEVLHEIHSILASRHPEETNLHFKMGQFSADRSLRGVYRIFLKVGNLGYIMNKAATVWGLYYSEGKMELLEREKKSVIVQVTEFPGITQAFCERLLGYMQKVGELNGETLLEYGIKDMTDNSCQLYFKW